MERGPGLAGGRAGPHPQEALPGALTHTGEAVLGPAGAAGGAIRSPATLGEGAGLLVCLQPAGQRGASLMASGGWGSS